MYVCPLTRDITHYTLHITQIVLTWPARHERVAEIEPIIFRARGLYGRILTVVVSTDRTQ